MADNTVVATEDLFVSRGVRAYYKGEELTREAADRNGWTDKVVGPNTKTAQAVKAEKVDEKA